LRLFLGAKDKELNPSFKDGSLQQYPVIAFLAFDADIRTQSNHTPFIGSAGMHLPQAYNIAKLDFHDHHLAPSAGRKELISSRSCCAACLAAAA
jgi:hypothetical protein